MNLERWGWYSIGVNSLLAALHGFIAAASGSLAVTAELVHNIVDIVASVAVLVGLKLATRQSKAFPYGLYKVENLVAAGLAILVFVTAYQVAQDALTAPSAALHVNGWMLAALPCTMALPLVFSHYELRAGRAANSPALIADAKEYPIHAFTTGLALAALLSTALAFPIDRAAALIIVIAVARTGWDMLCSAVRVLLDVSLDPATLRRIHEIVGDDPAVAEVKWVTGRNAGRFRFVEIGVTLRVAELDKAEAVIRRIEAAVRSAVPHVERALIQVESPSSDRVHYAIPLADRDGSLSDHFGEAPFFAFVTLRATDNAIEALHILENPHRRTEKAKGIRVAEWIVAAKVDGVLLRENLQGRGPDYVLHDAGVVLHHVDALTLVDAIRGP